jgi:SAM-dependent methyltransferase
MKTYRNYQEYLDHQASKLKNNFSEVIQKNHEYQKIVYRRYADFFSWRGQSVICLGARLGGEVEAFKRMGAVAIGIDIEPGISNKHVLYGDFHETNFADRSFDFVFSNCIDHVFDLDKFLKEIFRLLKSDGIGILEVAVQKAGEYETIDTQDITFIKQQINRYFKIKFEKPINNGWQGELIILKK